MCLIRFFCCTSGLHAHCLIRFPHAVILSEAEGSNSNSGKWKSF